MFSSKIFHNFFFLKKKRITTIHKIKILKITKYTINTYMVYYITV